MLIQLTRTTDMPVKPPFAAPCNGCGHCCERQVCDVGQRTFDLSPWRAPCPALEYDAADRRFYCGLVRRPAHYIRPDAPEFSQLNDQLSPMIAKLIDAGGGCGAPDFDEAQGHIRVVVVKDGAS